MKILYLADGNIFVTAFICSNSAWTCTYLTRKFAIVGFSPWIYILSLARDLVVACIASGRLQL